MLTVNKYKPMEVKQNLKSHLHYSFSLQIGGALRKVLWQNEVLNDTKNQAKPAGTNSFTGTRNLNNNRQKNVM